MRFLLFFGLILICNLSIAQQVATQLPDFKFDQRYTRCAQQWVVLPKPDKASSYVYGCVFIKNESYFAFAVRGAFSIDPSGNYVTDAVLPASIANAVKAEKIRDYWPMVALLPPAHFSELNLPAASLWVEDYYHSSNTAKFNYLIGKLYNESNEFDIAIMYLEKAHTKMPHPTDVELQLAIAYNSLEKYSETVALLQLPVLQKHNDYHLYARLGDAYFNLKDYSNAVSAYLTALDFFSTVQSEDKGKLAYDISTIYNLENKSQVAKIWMMKAKQFTPAESELFKKITSSGLN